MGTGVEREIIHRGVRFDLERLRLRAEDGSEVVREIVRHPGAVVIVPIDDDGRVVMIRNERPAVGGAVWELPAGTLETGEPAQATAARELEEETGYRAERVEKLGEFYTTPGLTDELMRAYVATGLEFVGQKLEAGERIEAEAVPLERVWEMVDSGELMDAKSICALTLAQRKGLL
jgi:ADP-ribose pyrophosphatase